MGELMAKSKLRTEFLNIWKLMKLQFSMQKYYYLAVVGIMLLSAIVNTLEIAFGKGRYDIDDTVLFLGSSACNLFSLVLLMILVAGNNFLGNEKISMYPGTVRSRVAARFSADYILITAMVLWEVILYLLGCGAVYLLTKSAGNVNTAFMFSGEYLLSGMLEMFFVSVTLYSLFSLGYAIFTRLGVVRFAVLCFAVIAVGGGISAFTEIKIDSMLEFFVGSEMSFGSFLLRLAGLWLVSMVFTWILVLTTKQWKKSNAYVLWAFLIAGVVMMPILIFAAHDETVIYEEDVQTELEAAPWLDYLEEGLDKDSVIEKCERLQDNLDLLDIFFMEPIASEDDGRDLWFNYGEILTVEQAKEMNYVSSDFTLPENSMVMRVTARDRRWNGIPLYEGLLKNLEVVKVKGEGDYYHLEYRLNNYSVVFPATLTRDYIRFGLTGVEEYEYDGENIFSAVLIVDEELMKAFNEWEKE